MLRSPRAVALLSVGAALSLLVIAVLVAPEVLHLRAAGDAGFGLAGLFRDSHVLLASPVLLSLRSAVTDLEARAAAKLAEIKDDLDGEALRRIESEHAELLRQLDGARGRLTAYEAAPPAPAPQADPAAAVRAERERIRTISDIALRAGMDQAAVDAAITAETSVDAFRSQAFDVVAGRAAAKPTSPIAETRGGQDETETRREAMVEYVLYRGGKGPLTDRAREMYRGMNAVDLARETLGWRGEKARGLLPDEIAQRSLMASSDFPSILAAGANKTLRAGYVAAPRTFKPWVRNIPLPDFKPYNIVRRGETPQLARMNEKGEFQRGAITESKEAIKLVTYGVVAGMTRQMIVNDDLGAFLGIPGDFGQSSATLESDIVYGLFLSNPALLTDNKAVFHADHKNLSPAAALSILSISAMRASMGLMTGLDGITLLNLTPRYLLVPPELETPAEQLTASVIVANEVSRAVPESIRSLKPIAEGRLSVGVKNKGAGVQAAGSSTAYYLISDMVDSIVTATLEGQDGPYIETRMGFDVDGVEIKCRHDFGAAAADYRGTQKNPGA